MQPQPRPAPALAAALFLAGLPLGAVLGLALVVAAFARVDDGINSAPRTSALLANCYAPSAILAIGLLLRHVGTGAAEQRGCVAALAGAGMSLAGGLLIGLTLTVYGAGVLVAGGMRLIG